MSGYEISFSITAVCPCCGKALPSSSYLTESKSSGAPLDRDNPYARKDRRVFITPCADCFEPKAAEPSEASLARVVEPDEDAVRYCYECGRIGEVDHEQHIDCCPDGNHARYVHPVVAEQAQGGFHAMLAAAQPSQAVELIPADVAVQLTDAAYEWSNYVDADHAPCTLLDHMYKTIAAINAKVST